MPSDLQRRIFRTGASGYEHKTKVTLLPRGGRWVSSLDFVAFLSTRGIKLLFTPLLTVGDYGLVLMKQAPADEDRDSGR